MLRGCQIETFRDVPDENGDGWSNEYGELSAAIAIMGEDPAASWLTYLVIGLGFLIGAAGALVVRMSRSRATMMEQLAFDAEMKLMAAPGMGAAVPQLIPLEDLPPLPAPQGGEIDGQ